MCNLLRGEIGKSMLMWDSVSSLSKARVNWRRDYVRVVVLKLMLCKTTMAY